MDFSFTEEQEMLLDSTRRFIAERYNFGKRQKVRGSADGWSRDVWQELGGLGLLGINVPEAEGGSEVDPISNMLVCNALGEGLILEPFLTSAVVATLAIVKTGSTEQRRHWLPRMASGELIAALAHQESGLPGDPADIQTIAVRSGEDWQISGRKALVYHAPAADVLLVSARVDGELGLFAIPTASPGLTLALRTTIDDQRAADVVLDRVRVAGAARLGADVRHTLQAALDYGLAALCAEAFGAMDRLLAATIAYSRSRVQFGVPIGSFQALQHRMVDMLMHLEQARSMSYLASTRCTEADSVTRSRSLAAAKVLIGQGARYIGQQAVQLHGGMGMTDELDVSHYFKRLLAFELRCGSTDHHLHVYSRQLLLP